MLNLYLQHIANLQCQIENRRPVDLSERWEDIGTEQELHAAELILAGMTVAELEEVAFNDCVSKETGVVWYSLTDDQRMAVNQVLEDIFILVGEINT